MHTVVHLERAAFHMVFNSVLRAERGSSPSLSYVLKLTLCPYTSMSLVPGVASTAHGSKASVSLPNNLVVWVIASFTWSCLVSGIQQAAARWGVAPFLNS